ncbi:hypothetical protein PROFUN_05029 [Planoprotostelium fungivorum]|uniref:DEP domain-containing protein n=1 Tax=Planoprotostelium fungivorum TaxID=1890364 RepID=A0A2P6NS57_9EUKA|nr:hypothetical protein PROFUN_05029 [Planoprotostelium fungivorum]
MKKRRVEEPNNFSASEMLMGRKTATVVVRLGKDLHHKIILVNDAAKSLLTATPIVEPPNISVIEHFWSVVAEAESSSSVKKEISISSHISLFVEAERFTHNQDEHVLVTAERNPSLKPKRDEVCRPNDLAPLINIIEEGNILEKTFGNSVYLCLCQFEELGTRHRYLAASETLSSMLKHERPWQVRNKTTEDMGQPKADVKASHSLYLRHLNEEKNVANFTIELVQMPGITHYTFIRRISTDVILTFCFVHDKKNVGPPNALNEVEAPREWSKLAWDEFITSCLRYVKTIGKYTTDNRHPLPEEFLKDQRSVFCYVYHGHFLPSRSADGCIWKSSRGARIAGSIIKRYAYATTSDGIRLKRMVSWIEGSDSLCFVEYRHHHTETTHIDNLIGTPQIDWHELAKSIHTQEPQKFLDKAAQLSSQFTMASEGRDVEFAENVVDYVNRRLDLCWVGMLPLKHMGGHNFQLQQRDSECSSTLDARMRSPNYAADTRKVNTPTWIPHVDSHEAIISSIGDSIGRVCLSPRAKVHRIATPPLHRLKEKSQSPDVPRKLLGASPSLGQVPLQPIVFVGSRSNVQPQNVLTIRKEGSDNVLQKGVALLRRKKEDKPTATSPSSLNEGALNAVLKKLLSPTDGIKLRHKGGHSNSFSGARLIKWLRIHEGLPPAEAQKFATILMEHGAFCGTVPTKRYDFQHKKGNYYTFNIHNEESPLNACKYQMEEVIDAVSLSKQLVELVCSIIKDHTGPDGVDFSAAKKSERYLDLCLLSAGLQEVCLSVMSPEERSAFYVNVHNVLALHGRFLLEREPKGDKDRVKLRESTYIIGQQPWTMSDLSDAIRGVGEIGLEGNHPIIVCLLFKGTDKCAPIRPYSSEDLTQNRLRNLMSEHLQQHGTFLLEEGRVVLPHHVKKTRGDYGPVQPRDMMMSLSYLMRSRTLRETAEELTVSFTEPVYNVKMYVK